MFGRIQIVTECTHSIFGGEQSRFGSFKRGKLTKGGQRDKSVSKQTKIPNTSDSHIREKMHIRHDN